MTLCNSDDHLNGNDNEDKCDANSSNNEPEYTVLESPTWIGFAVFKTILINDNWTSWQCSNVCNIGNKSTGV